MKLIERLVFHVLFLTAIVTFLWMILSIIITLF